MHLFRSEEHVRAWPEYNPAAADGTLALADCARVFGVDYWRARLEPDFFLRAPALRRGMAEALASVGKGGPFWITEAPDDEAQPSW